MKRTVSLLLLLLIIGGLFLVADLVNQMNRTSSNDMEDANSYWIFDDIPAIKASSVAYLLDPDFTVTPENFADCINDYFSAPAVLYFWDTFHTDSYRAMNNSEKASAFSAVFRDVSFLSISQEEYPSDLYNNMHWEEQFDILNAIGALGLRLCQGETYISFYRPGHPSGYDTTYFRVEGDLISECISVAESLKDDSVEANGFEPPH